MAPSPENLSRVPVLASPGILSPDCIFSAESALSSVLQDLHQPLSHCLLTPSQIAHIPFRYSYIFLTTPRLVFSECQYETQHSALNAAVKIGVHLRALLLVNRAERGELGGVGFEFGGGCVKSLVKMSMLRT